MSNTIKLPFSFAMNIDTRNENNAEVLQEQREKTFCIAMLGNLSGKQNSSEKASISERNFIEIDRYNFDEVLASMNITLTLSLNQDGTSTVDVPLHSLKDFHPDKLYKNVNVFEQLRDLRNRLNNPQTFWQAAEEFGLLPLYDDPPSPEEPITVEKPQPQATEELPPAASGSSLLDSIMAETEGRSRAGVESSLSATDSVQESKTRVDAFIQQLVARGSRNVSRDARQDELVASIDETIAQQMSSLLHNPQFQALESVWRSVHFLVKRIRNNEGVKLYLLDVSRDELTSDLSIDDVTQTQLYQQFCDTSVGDIDWSLIIGDYRFGADIDDILLLSQIGMIAQQSGAQFIAAADEKLVGCNSFANTPKADRWLDKISQPVDEAWTLIRNSPVAKNISLALPRFLLRAPYGQKSARVNTFAFEEMSELPEHRNYLWGNPAFLKAEQIARSFIQSGWEMQYAKVMNTEDLPVHYYQEDGQTIIKPCAEISLTDTGASKMIAQGLIPLWSVKNKDIIHSGDFHSIVE